MNSEQVEEPLAAKECMSQLIIEQRLLYAEELKLLHSLEFVTRCFHILVLNMRK